MICILFKRSKKILKYIQKHNLENDILDELTPKNNTEDIKKSLLNLTRDNLRIGEVKEILEDLRNNKKSLIYEELDTLDKLQLMSIKSNITILPKYSYSKHFIAMITAFWILVFEILFNYTLEYFKSNEFIKSLIPQKEIIIASLVALTIIVVLFIIVLFCITDITDSNVLPPENKQRINQIGTLINNFIDDILTKRK